MSFVIKSEEAAVRWLKMKNSNQKASFFDWCKILFPVISAGLVAATGAYYTKQSAFNTTAKDYVKIGVDILTSPDEKYDKDIKLWAAKLVDHYSPVKWSEVVESKIIAGYALKSEAPGPFATAVDKALYQKFDSYELHWEGNNSSGYQVIAEQLNGDDWVRLTGASTSQNSIEISTPKNKKIRWKVITYTFNGSVEKTTEWKYIEPQNDL
ncbi:hypothetical protein AB4278_05440 [Vibrio splendidus]